MYIHIFTVCTFYLVFYCSFLMQYKLHKATMITYPRRSSLAAAQASLLDLLLKVSAEGFQNDSYLDSMGAGLEMDSIGCWDSCSKRLLNHCKPKNIYIYIYINVEQLDPDERWWEVHLIFPEFPLSPCVLANVSPRPAVERSRRSVARPHSVWPGSWGTRCCPPASRPEHNIAHRSDQAVDEPRLKIWWFHVIPTLSKCQFLTGQGGADVLSHLGDGKNWKWTMIEIFTKGKNCQAKFFPRRVKKNALSYHIWYLLYGTSRRMTRGKHGSWRQAATLFSKSSNLGIRTKQQTTIKYHQPSSIF